MGGCSGGFIRLLSVYLVRTSVRHRSMLESSRSLLHYQGLPAPAPSSRREPLSGTPEKGDRLGTTLALDGYSDDSAGKSDRVFIGVPGEDVGTTGDAGIVQSTPVGNSTNITAAGTPRSAVGYSGGTLTGTNMAQ